MVGAAATDDGGASAANFTGPLLTTGRKLHSFLRGPATNILTYQRRHVYTTDLVLLLPYCYGRSLLASQHVLYASPTTLASPRNNFVYHLLAHTNTIDALYRQFRLLISSDDVMCALTTIGA